LGKVFQAREAEAVLLKLLTLMKDADSHEECSEFRTPAYGKAGLRGAFPAK
jgi:hypothetical protein